MSDLLNRLGYLQTRRDRTPNLDLARDLVARGDTAGIREIAENMWNDSKNIHADCMNVMYEIGRIAPDLITQYAGDFIKFLKSKHHNMVQGATIALAEIAKVKPDFTFTHLAEIKKIKETSSDNTTVDKSISTLAHTASANEDYSGVIFPYLLQHLLSCHHKEVPEHAERILPAVNENNNAAFIKTCEKRLDELSGSDFTRLKKIIRIAEKL
jgi:ferritin